MNSISLIFESYNDFVTNIMSSKDSSKKIKTDEINEDDYYHVESEEEHENNGQVCFEDKININNEDYIPEIYRTLDIEENNEVNDLIKSENKQNNKNSEGYDIGIANLNVEFSEIELKEETYLNSKTAKLALMSSVVASFLIYGICKKK